MVLLESPLGGPKTYPQFELNDSFGVKHTSKDLMAENGLIILFTCNHCPYAKALWKRVINDYSVIADAGFSLVAINPNINPNYPDDSPEKMQELVESYGLPFPYLVDELQEIASNYDAVCTPDLFVLDPTMQLLYRGAYDNNWKDESSVSERYLINVVTTTVDQGFVVAKQPSMGCSIKWVKNN
jgi:peroxiredoxin